MIHVSAVPFLWELSTQESCTTQNTCMNKYAYVYDAERNVGMHINPYVLTACI
jgi:hypothetical protein